MKTVYFTLMLVFIGLSSKAQTMIKPLNDLDFRDSSGTYYKDIDNEMAPFIGTWLYDNGSIQFKIILKKETRYDYNGRYFIDLLVGEYQYIVDGVEKINTLDQLDVAQGFGHEIDGMFNIKNCNIPPSQNCEDGQSRYHLSILDPTENRVSGNLVLHRVLNSISNEMEAFMTFGYGGSLSEGETMPTPTMPWQERYVFVKQ